jgi:hypothetical protein
VRVDAGPTVAAPLAYAGWSVGEEDWPPACALQPRKRSPRSSPGGNPQPSDKPTTCARSTTRRPCRAGLAALPKGAPLAEVVDAVRPMLGSWWPGGPVVSCSRAARRGRYRPCRYGLPRSAIRSASGSGRGGVVGTDSALNVTP